jgi:hypothetical protein
MLFNISLGRKGKSPQAFSKNGAVNMHMLAFASICLASFMTYPANIPSYQPRMW